MNKTKIDKEVVTLKDVLAIIIAWRNSCTERGQISAGVLNFITTNPEEREMYENLQWIFGEEGTAMNLHHENTLELSEEPGERSGSEKMKDGDAIVFRMWP